MRPSMSRNLAFLLLCVLRPTQGGPLNQRDDTLLAKFTRQKAISWTACNDKFDCASFKVPLDYAKPTAGTAALALIRYNATRSPRLGALFTNPGGPGGSGIADMLEWAETYSNQTGGFYDVIGWDPRGVGSSEPHLSCFSSPEEEFAFWGDSLPSEGLDARPGFSSGFSDPNDITALYLLESETDSKLKKWGKRCHAKSGDALKYIGTAATVRDMVSIANAIDGPKSPINYYGRSYGTVIGAYFVNMFPRRVGRIILDGVVNPVGWTSAPSYKLNEDWFQDAELVLRGFCESCSSASNRCAYNPGGNSTATEICDNVHKLIDTLRTISPRGFPYGGDFLRNYILTFICFPLLWDDFAIGLVAFEADAAKFIEENGKNTTSSGSHSSRIRSSQSLSPRSSLRGREAFSNLPGSVRSEIQQSQRRKRQVEEAQNLRYSFQAISCSDAADSGRTTTKDVLDEIVHVAQDVTPTFGPMWNSAGYHCHRYPVRAVERYQGPWNAKLANKILIIGNSGDPLTPLASAKFLAEQLGSSAVLLENKGFGHTITAMPSNCTLDWFAKYMISGKLPPKGTVCTSSETFFRGESEDDDAHDIPLYTTISPSPIH